MPLKLGLPQRPILQRLPRLPQLPLPITGLCTAALLLIPAVLLLAFPRRSATGLERLIPSAALLQSFPAQPLAAPPALWRQRLGPALAARLWPQQRRLWWQFWGAHGDAAGAFLVFAAPRAQPLPPRSLRVDDLVVVAPNPLARELLHQELRVRRRSPRGLALRCTHALKDREAVHWNASGLSQMLGPLAPLAQGQQQGCLVLTAQGRGLLWSGEAEASDGVQALAPPDLTLAAPQPLTAGQLLELRGRRLDLLLQGLLGSPVLRQSLARSYGLSPDVLRVLQPTAFQLRLREVPRGPFLAALELQLEASRSGRPTLERWLDQLSGALTDQGLESSRPLPGLIAWNREDGTVVGGWRWSGQRQRLLLFLGPVPGRLAAPQPVDPGDWQLRFRPAAMASLGLLPSGVPAVVRRADQLELVGKPVGLRPGERQSALAGRLQLP